MMNVVGCDPEDVEAYAREWADDLLIDGNLEVRDVAAFFRWLREPESDADAQAGP
jgi:hypothetical protein